MESIYEELRKTLESRGDEAALQHLARYFHDRKEFNSLFYTRLMQKRHQLKLCPIPTGPARDIPEEHHTAFEEAIRTAGREVGKLYLEEGNIPQAWAYFRMLGEPEPIRQALERVDPAAQEDLQGLVQIAYYENVYPTKGFDWILESFGLCNAITTLGSQGLPQDNEVRQHCLRAVVRALYGELRERLALEVERHEGKPPEEAGAPAGAAGLVRRLIQGRDWLFGEDMYHVDVSHLSSVVQMSMHLEPCTEMGMVRELCAYGQRLSQRFLGEGDPPFENLYLAMDHYLAILSGEGVEEGLAYFRQQAESADPDSVGSYPAEVLVNLLLRLDRRQEALQVACAHLTREAGRQMSCPGIPELCQMAGDYQALARVSESHDDPVHFLAGLLGARCPQK